MANLNPSSRSPDRSGTWPTRPECITSNHPAFREIVIEALIIAAVAFLRNNAGVLGTVVRGFEPEEQKRLSDALTNWFKHCDKAKIAELKVSDEKLRATSFVQGFRRNYAESFARSCGRYRVPQEILGTKET